MAKETFRAITTKLYKTLFFFVHAPSYFIQRDGVQGPHHVLYDEINDKPRVTKNHV